jgi:hypothetical protein
MLNWRALVLYAIPTIGDRRGMALTLGLGALTALCLVPVWRGAWRPRDRRFPLRFSALTLATLLSSYHSHLYGAALLVVPLASLIAEGRPGRLARGAVGALVLVPTLLLAVTLLAMAGMLPAGQVPVAQLFGLLLLACYGCLLGEAWRERRWAG